MPSGLYAKQLFTVTTVEGNVSDFFYLLPTFPPVFCIIMIIHCPYYSPVIFIVLMFCVNVHVKTL